MNTIESYLPVFTGFYNTLLEADEESYIEDGKTYDSYDWDYKEYHERIAKNCAEIIDKKLKEAFGISVNFQNLVSPKYYNYSNDSINVKYQLESDSFKRVVSYILENKEDFDGYIREHYTSYDGFVSHYSNDGTEWITNYILDKEKLDHVFGTCLEFYFQSEGYNLESLYYDLQDVGEGLMVYGNLID